MTIVSPVSRIVHKYSAAVSTYAFPFKIFNTTQVTVECVDDDGDVVSLALGVDYSIPTSGVGTDAGGNVVIATTGAGKLTTGWNMVITRNMEFTQETDYSPHDVFPAETHERALDILTMMCQELRQMLGRAVLAPPDIENPIQYAELLQLYEEMRAAVDEAKKLLENILSDAEGSIQQIIENAIREMNNTAAIAIANLQATIAAAEARVDEILRILTANRPFYRGLWTAGEQYIPNQLVRGPDGMLYLTTETFFASDFQAEVNSQKLVPWGVPLGGDEVGQREVWMSTALGAGGTLRLPIPYFPTRNTMFLFYDNIPCYPKGIGAAYQYEEVGLDPNELSWDVIIDFDMEANKPMMMVILPSAFASSVSRVEAAAAEAEASAQAAAGSATQAASSALDAGASAANAADKALAALDSADRAVAAETNVINLIGDAEAAKTAAQQAATNSQTSADASAASATAAAQSASKANMYHGQAQEDADAARSSAQAAEISANNAANSAVNAGDQADSSAGHANDALATLNTFLARLAAGLDASDIKTGTFDIARIPDSANETIVTVESEQARLLLTISEVQNGDTVRVIQPDGTSKRYGVIDDTRLSQDGTTPGDEAAFLEYSAGQASSVEWADILNKPDNLLIGAHAISHSSTGEDPVSPASIGAAVDLSTLTDQAASNQNLALTETAVAARFQQARNLFKYLLQYIDPATGLFPISSGGTGKATAQEAALALFPATLGNTANRLAGVNGDGTVSGTVSLASLASLLSAAGITVPWGSVTGKPATVAPSAHAASHAIGGTDPLRPENDTVVITTLTAALSANSDFANCPQFLVGSGRLKVSINGVKCYNGTDTTYHQYMEIGTTGQYSNTIRFNFALEAGMTIEAYAPKI